MASFFASLLPARFTGASSNDAASSLSPSPNAGVSIDQELEPGSAASTARISTAAEGGEHATPTSGEGESAIAARLNHVLQLTTTSSNVNGIPELSPGVVAPSSAVSPSNESSKPPPLPLEQEEGGSSSQRSSRRNSKNNIMHPPPIKTALQPDTPTSSPLLAAASTEIPGGAASASSTSTSSSSVASSQHFLSPSAASTSGTTNSHLLQIPRSSPRSPDSGGSATPPPEGASGKASISPGSMMRARSQSVTHLPSQLEQRQRWLARKQQKYQNQSVFGRRNCCF